MTCSACLLPAPLGMRRGVVAVLLLFLLASLLSGCVAVPISGPRQAPLAGSRFVEEKIPLVAPVGRSRQEVISSLGPPTIELEQYRLLVFPWIEHKSDWLVFLVPPGHFLYAFTTPRTEDWALVIAFDAEDRVANAALLKRAPQLSINAVARDWLQAQGVKLPRPNANFAIPPVPEGRSHIYVYRVSPPITPLSLLGAGSWPTPIAVSLDGTVRSELSDEKFVMLTVDPGQHDLVADALPPYRYSPTGSLTIPPERRRPASVAIHASPNERYFVELMCASGTGTVETTLKEQPQATAVEIVREFRSVW